MATGGGSSLRLAHDLVRVGEGEGLGAAPGHIPALDGLRGCAVLLVLGYHFLHLDGLERHPLDRGLLAVAGAGWAGVDLFFVLSGFLITGILLDAKRCRGSLAAFWARRALRIFPLHYAYLAALFLMVPLLAPGAGPSVPAPVQSWFWTYTANVFYALRGTFDGGPALTAHFWSLAVEEQFYAVWPLAVWALPRRALAWTCAALVVSAALLRALFAVRVGNATAAYVLTPCRMDALAVGALVATVARGEGGWIVLRRCAPWVALGSTACVAAVAACRRGLFGGDPVVQVFAFTPIALGFGAVLVLAVTAGRGAPPARLLASRCLVVAGRYSYGLYVLHYPVLRVLEARGFRASRLPTFAGSSVPALLAFAAVAGALSFASALASWRLVEKPWLRLKMRVPYAVGASPR